MNSIQYLTAHTNENVTALVQRIVEAESIRPTKLDWLGFEVFVRDVLNATQSRYITHRDALLILNEAMGAYTGRGDALNTWNAPGDGPDHSTLFAA